MTLYYIEIKERKKKKTDSQFSIGVGGLVPLSHNTQYLNEYYQVVLHTWGNDRKRAR